MKSIIFASFFSLLLFQDNTNVSEEVKYQMYLEGLNNWSTSPSFIVINVKNLNNGELKELCVEAPFLRSAISFADDCSEIKSKSRAFKVPKKLVENKNRYFQFQCEKSLKNIGFNSYSPDDLKSFQNEINLDSIITLIKESELKQFSFGEKTNDKMLAHLLFNHGIPVRMGSRSSWLYFTPLEE